MAVSLGMFDGNGCPGDDEPKKNILWHLQDLNDSMHSHLRLHFNNEEASDEQVPAHGSLPHASAHKSADKFHSMSSTHCQSICSRSLPIKSTMLNTTGQVCLADITRCADNM